MWAQGVAWRFAILGGLSAGLAAAPLFESGPSPELLVIGLVAAGALAAAAPRNAPRCARIVWVGLLGLAFAAVGAGTGLARLAAIDAGALDLEAGRRVTVAGHVGAVPRRANGTVSVRVDTPDGRVVLEAPEPVPDLPVGRAVRATGTVRDPEDWEAAWLLRLGIRDVVSTGGIELRSGRRGGFVALLDETRTRAEVALGRGTDPARAALLRGFVLGQDDRIEGATVEEFRRSGLSHLLAVSGQNVLLLALLAWPLLALLGLRLRSRLLVTLALIAVYVPVAGAGPSIQRAGIMGAAGVLAALAGRPRSRAYVLLLATAATLALNPRVTGDPGWQLSFAAVAGIMLWARPLRARLVGKSQTAKPGAALVLRSALADGVAVTAAATLATAPLIAQQFGVVSLASLPANLLALPAVAPVMWLGMLAALAGQLPWLPVEPLTWLAGAFAGYIAQIASWLAAPGWSQVEVDLGAPWALAGAYAAVAAAVALVLRWSSRRARLRPGRTLAAVAMIPLAAAGAILGAPAVGPGQAEPAAAGRAGLRMTVLDVGQGDAILLEPRDGDPVLIDAGPPESEAEETLRGLGVERLGALIATHPERDHVGGAPAVLAEIPTARVLYASADQELRGAAAANATPGRTIAAGSRLRSGALRIEVLWPPPERLGARDDPNQLSLVLLASWHQFEILLAGDAEAELAPVDPGPVEVLKVAHHGSEDTGLDELLDRTSPQLALISVGEGNPYGHPSPATLSELAEHDVPVARTDEAGALTIDVDRTGFRLRTGG